MTKKTDLTFDELLDSLRMVLARQYDTNPEKVVPDAGLEDIGLDSLALIEVLFQLEEQLDISIDDVDKNIKTVGELISNLHHQIQSRNSGQSPASA